VGIFPDNQKPTPPGKSDRRGYQNTIFRKVPHDLFKFTTADENDGLGESVGADLRAATSLTWATAARERDGHLEACIFIKAADALFGSHPGRVIR